MEPPKHKHTKVPRGPTSPPAPVLHSPPRKLTVEDQQAWKIPSCVSNWKNARGYTIPLDKRLAADGRGLQEVTINNKFATLSESLYVAERKAAEGLKMRNQLRKKMAMQEKEDKERELRDMANRARQERSGALHPHGEEDVDGVRGRGEPNEAPYYSSDDQGAGSGDDEEAERGHAGETEEERVARFQREKLRIQRRKERERELRIENMKGNFRKNKLDRDSDRDVSEKVALGMHTGSGKLTGEAMYDSRLFNQSAGLDQGFGAEDEYNTYSKSLFEGRGETQSIYRPRQDDSDVYGSAEEQVSNILIILLHSRARNNYLHHLLRRLSWRSSRTRVASRRTRASRARRPPSPGRSGPRRCSSSAAGIGTPSASRTWWAAARRLGTTTVTIHKFKICSVDSMAWWFLRVLLLRLNKILELYF